MKKNQEIAKKLLDWADELEDLNINQIPINDVLVVQDLVKDLHIAAGQLMK